MGASAFSSDRSRPIIVDIAISAPARSIEAQATSISRLRITSRIDTLCTSTSYIDFSRVSGSIPCDIVRLPCGSMSTQSTRWPSSANAAARFSVVVVFATPPFWLANAMTLALPSTVAPMLDWWKAVRWVFACAGVIPARHLRSRHGSQRAPPAALQAGRQADRDLPRGRRRGQDDDRGGAGARARRRGAEGGGGHDRPGPPAGDLARACTPLQRAPADRAGRAGGDGDRGPRRAVGDGARRQAHVRRDRAQA